MSYGYDEADEIVPQRGKKNGKKIGRKMTMRRAYKPDVKLIFFSKLCTDELR